MPTQPVTQPLTAPGAPIVDPERFARDEASVGTRIDPRLVRSNESNVDPASRRERDVAGLDPEITALVLQKTGAPNAAKAFAQALLDRYGPFTADNSVSNTNAILAHMRWLAGTAIIYDDARIATSTDDGNRMPPLGTHSPNTTINGLSGVCRDTHTAVAAVLGALGSARQEGGRWVLGEARGQEGRVVAAGYYNPDEYHAFTAYMDPHTGKWNALEYGSTYDLRADDAVAVFRALTGNTAGLWRYTLRGWDQGPIVATHQHVDSARARDFFLRDPGRGTPGQLQLSAQGDAIDASLHLSEAIAVTARVAPVASAFGMGAMAHVNERFAGTLGDASLHLGAGVFNHRFTATTSPGRRAHEDRVDYSEWLLGGRADARFDSHKLSLIGEHLQLRVGADADVLLVVPMTNTYEEEKGPVSLGRMFDYSNIDVGAHARLFGAERLGDVLAFDWSVYGRSQVDLAMLATEATVTAHSEGGVSVRGSLLDTPHSVGAQLGVTLLPQAAVVVRAETGAHARLGADIAPDSAVRGAGYAAVRVGDRRGTYQLSLTAAGRLRENDALEPSEVAVSAELRPSDALRLSLTASVDPTTQLATAGAGLQLSF